MENPRNYANNDEKSFFNEMVEALDLKDTTVLADNKSGSMSGNFIETGIDNEDLIVVNHPENVSMHQCITANQTDAEMLQLNQCTQVSDKNIFLDSSINFVEITSDQPMHVGITDTSFELTNSTTSFYNNIPLCSTKNFDGLKEMTYIDVTTDSNSLIEEYRILRKKVNPPRYPNQEVKIIETKNENQINILNNEVKLKYVQLDINIAF